MKHLKNNENINESSGFIILLATWFLYDSLRKIPKGNWTQYIMENTKEMFSDFVGFLSKYGYQVDKEVLRDKIDNIFRLALGKLYKEGGIIDYETGKLKESMKELKKFEAWSELSMANKLKLGLGAAAAITGATVIAINDSDTKITESDGTIRQGVAGEEFTGTVTYSNRSVDLYNFHNIGIECKDGTLVEVSIDLSDIKRRNIKEGSVITISITEDTWMFRNDADVVESMKYLKRFSEINESLPRQHTVDQLKRLRKLTKGTDIGDRISDMNKEGANIQYIQNPIDTGIESYEDYEKANKKFIPSWNLKHLSGPFGGKKNKKK